MEEWRSIPGYTGLYEVSNYGQVRSLTYRKGRGDVFIQLKAPFVLKQAIKKGYTFVTLFDASRPGKRKVHKVARLVLSAFVGPCPVGYEASHLDGVRRNNRIENLLWEPHVVNNARKIAHGTAQIGEKNPAAKLTAQDIVQIRALRGQKTRRMLAAQFGVHPGTIKDILSRRSWLSVP